MRDIARDFAQIFDQSLDPVEHAVKRHRELIELVLATTDGHSLANVAANDGFRRSADGPERR